MHQATPTSTGVAETPARRKGDPVMFGGLSAYVGLLNGDRSVVLITAHTHCGQKVGLRLSRKVARELAGDIARLEGYELVRSGPAPRPQLKRAHIQRAEGESTASLLKRAVPGLPITDGAPTEGAIPAPRISQLRSGLGMQQGAAS